jgi:EEF1A N-terminal glycine/lysine methyltransferase
MFSMRRLGVPATAVAASPIPADKIIKSHLSDQSLERKKSKMGAYKASQWLDLKKASVRASGAYDAHTPIINISVKNNNITPPSATIPAVVNTDAALADELDYITVTTPNISNPESPTSVRPDKAARILGIRHGAHTCVNS